MTEDHKFVHDGIVALHGNLGGVEDWAGIDLLGGRALDLWRYAGSSLSEVADGVTEEASKNFRTPILAGYSMGGRIALHALARNPERWSGAILLATHPGLLDPEARMDRLAVDRNWAARARSWDWERFLATWNGQEILGQPSSALFQRQMGLESRRESIADAFESWSLGGQEDLRRSLIRFRGPVLWIVGEEDLRFLNLGIEMTSVFENFQLLRILGVGHRILDAGESGSTQLAHAIRYWTETHFAKDPQSATSEAAAHECG